MFQRPKIVLGEKGEVHSAQKALFIHLDLCTGEAIQFYGQLVRWSI